MPNIFVHAWKRKIVFPKSKKKLQIFNNGKNNKIDIQNPDLFLNSKLCIDGNNCRVIIKNARYIRYTNIWIYNGDNQTIVIDDDVSVERALMYLCGQNSKLTIKKDSMLAAGVSIWTADGHTIKDNKTGNILNNKENHIIIGEHVWIAQDVKLLKNAKIADGCIVGASSCICKEFKTPNCIIAGNPAEQIKTDISWEREDPYKKKVEAKKSGGNGQK